MVNTLEKYLNKRKATIDEQTPSTSRDGSGEAQPIPKQTHREIDLLNLAIDPWLRYPMSNYHPNDRETIRRAYLLRGPCQPRNHNFSVTTHGRANRKFKWEWFDEFGDWLEYNIDKDVAFCLYCYLFRCSIGSQGGGNCFTLNGFTNWGKKNILREHVGKFGSAHNQAYKSAQVLMNQTQYIGTFLNRQSNQARSDYRVRLNAVVDCCRFLLQEGLAFRGHNESKKSINQGHFLELLKYTARHNEAIDSVVLDNAPDNDQLIAPEIQKDIVNAAAVETTNVILKDCGDSLFAVLVDEARDVSIKEQMAVVIRYVDSRGCVIERFLAMVHVSDASAILLKNEITRVFTKHGLSIASLRGKGYDGASNMRGGFNGLKSLIMKENGSAFYVHYFAHQLQLALVSVAKSEKLITLLFSIVSNMTNIVGASCKRRDALREKQAKNILDTLLKGEISSGKGKNQETNLKRSRDTCWSSHYGSLLNFILMFSSVLDVLENVAEDGSNTEQRGEAYGLLNSLQSFDFMLSLYLMKNILAISHDLSKALQRKDQDIVNAMGLVEVTKTRLQTMRDSGWGSLLDEVSSVCTKHNIYVPQMDDKFVAPGRPRRNTEEITNLHYYCIGLFYACIDRHRQELNDRFNKANTDLLLCMVCLSPRGSFATFYKQKLVRFAQFYPSDFSELDLMVLHDQLETYILDVSSSNNEFLNLKGISDLAKKMVETKKNIVFPLVYLLITLLLILPVATATVERVFSALHIVKNRLRNRIGDEWLNDCLVTYIEKDIFKSIDSEAIMQRFQKMDTRRGNL